jgi:hypothetical protein
MEIINNENNNFDRLDNNDHNESLTIIEMKIRSTMTIPTGMETRATVTVAVTMAVISILVKRTTIIIMTRKTIITKGTVMKTLVALRAVTKVKQ